MTFPWLTCSYAIKHWAQLIRHGGKLVTDVPTEDGTIRHLRFNNLRHAVGFGHPFDCKLVKGIRSLERCFVEAGLQVEQSWRTKSELPKRSFSKDKGDRAFEEYINITKEPLFTDVEKLQKAREKWRQLWTENMDHEGRIWDGHAMHVTVGNRRPEQKVTSSEGNKLHRL